VLCKDDDVVAGRRFFAHRIALLASSDAFRAMFDGGYREKEAKDIEIPNISWKVFELMMRYMTLCFCIIISSFLMLVQMVVSGFFIYIKLY
jgi:hypothetical protein